MNSSSGTQIRSFDSVSACSAAATVAFFDASGAAAGAAAAAAAAAVAAASAAGALGSRMRPSKVLIKSGRTNLALIVFFFPLNRVSASSASSRG